MNNDLEQFSEERLQGFIDRMSVGNMRNSPTLQEMLSLYRIALSAKQTVPAGYLENGKGFMYEPRHKELIKNPTPVYGVPPLEIPDGWKLIPIEPTEAMLDEFDSIIDFGAEDSRDAWMRLIAAAPKPESE